MMIKQTLIAGLVFAVAVPAFASSDIYNYGDSSGANVVQVTSIDFITGKMPDGSFRSVTLGYPGAVVGVNTTYVLDESSYAAMKSVNLDVLSNTITTGTTSKTSFKCTFNPSQYLGDASNIRMVQHLTYRPTQVTPDKSSVTAISLTNAYNNNGTQGSVIATCSQI
jgi:hypothetical protein